MDRAEKKEHMRELVELLNKAGKSYYQGTEEMMSNLEYDMLYDELLDLEKEIGLTLSNSPTVNVGYEVLSELPKEKHESQMLSLDKTKEVSQLMEFLGEQEAVLSWKLDGLTIVLTYKDGRLQKAVTRGNGEIGEVVTNNAKAFKNLPLQIAYRGELILRGEAVISYRDFEKINEEIEAGDAKYKNPRNLCSGSVRQLNNEITAKRNVCFYAFSLVKADGMDNQNSRMYQLQWLSEQGFEVVESKKVTKRTIEQDVIKFSEKIQKNNIPSDGLVLIYDDIAYGEALGHTSKFPRDSYAFKWADETKETILTEIEWSPSRTGLINPVAIFEPVELEGSTVSRASVHNISILEELELGIGDAIEVYKANMIIPQIAQNHTRSHNVEPPKQCPVCGGATEIKKISNAKALYCINPRCQAKKMKSYALFVSRDALNIEGLSEATLEKFIVAGFIKEYADIFHLDRYKEEIQNMEGFGEKSYENLMKSIDKARITTLPKVIYSMGIANIGLANAKMICREIEQDVERVMDITEEELSDIQGVGEVIASAYVGYFKGEANRAAFENLLKELVIPKEENEDVVQVFQGQSFVITGTVERFSNRSELKEWIEEKGGKVTGSVTSKTNYLINNNKESSSSKNKKAKELDVPIISEDEVWNIAEQSM